MKELSVVYRGFGASVLLGTLADDGNAVLFQYSLQAIEQRLDLSPLRLPLRQPAYPDVQGQYRELHDVPGLVYDSLPEIQAVPHDDGYEVLAELARAGGSPGGARPKAQVFFNPQTGASSTQATQVPGGEPWLVKFAGSDDAPDIYISLYVRTCEAGS